MKMPSGSVHDIRYLYTIIDGISQQGGTVQATDKTLRTFRNLINEFNDAKASRIALSFRPRGVNLDVVKDTVSELVSLNVVKREGEAVSLTELGRRIAALIAERQGEQLRRLFAKLMLAAYSVFQAFLSQLSGIQESCALTPIVTSSLLDRFEGDSRRIVDYVLQTVERRTRASFANQLVAESVDFKSIDKLGRTAKAKRLQAITEKVVVSGLFPGVISNQRTFDFIRSRTTFLELTNYGIFDVDGLLCEFTYPISGQKPLSEFAQEPMEYSEGVVYLNRPTFEQIEGRLRKSIDAGYKQEKDEFGYAQISDVRDSVCRDLRISDNLFDSYLRRLSDASPGLFSFSVRGAGEKITEKRAPLIIDKPVRELYTLIMVNQRQ